MMAVLAPPVVEPTAPAAAAGEQPVGEESAIDYAIKLRAGEFTPDDKIDVEGIEVAADGRDRAHFLLQFVGSERFDEPSDKPADSQAINLLGYVGGNAFVASAGLKVLDDLVDDERVRFAGPIDPKMKVASSLQDGKPPPWAIKDGRLVLVVNLHEDVDVVDAVEKLTGAGDVTEVDEGLRIVVMAVKEAAVWDIAELDFVAFVEPAPAPVGPFMEEARPVSGVETVHRTLGLNGKDTSVFVYDSGIIDSAHPDFAGRVGMLDASEVPETHATHVAGIAVGDGTAGGSGTDGTIRLRGIAPGADVHSFGHDGAVLPDLLPNLALVSEVDVINLSIGSRPIQVFEDCDAAARPNSFSRAIDTIVLGNSGAANVPITLVQASGNERTEGLPCGETFTLTPTAAKNSIVVGSVDVEDPTRSSPFSSWGPMRSGRLGIDLMAPGCSRSGIEAPDVGGGYVPACGTSMASPHVTGGVSLLTEFFEAFYGAINIDPHTMRGLLIHTASDAGAPGPDSETGFGVINIEEAVKLVQENADAGLPFGDGGIIETGSVSSTFDATYQIGIDPDDATARFTLAWDDPLASAMSDPALVNDLDLVVIDPMGRRHFPLVPAERGPAAPGIDSLNNVEMVVATAIPGTWEVRVSGLRVTSGEQPFTLISDGEAAPIRIDAAITFVTASGPDCGDFDFKADVSMTGGAQASMSFGPINETNPLSPGGFSAFGWRTSSVVDPGASTVDLRVSLKDDDDGFCLADDVIDIDSGPGTDLRVRVDLAASRWRQLDASGVPMGLTFPLGPTPVFFTGGGGGGDHVGTVGFTVSTNSLSPPMEVGPATVSVSAIQGGAISEDSCGGFDWDGGDLVFVDGASGLAPLPTRSGDTVSFGPTTLTGSVGAGVERATVHVRAREDDDFGVCGGGDDVIDVHPHPAIDDGVILIDTRWDLAWLADADGRRLSLLGGNGELFTIEGFHDRSGVESGRIELAVVVTHP